MPDGTMKGTSRGLAGPLFALYVVLYGGFMVMCAFTPDVMAKRWFGVNGAVLYGLGLIVIAIVLAAIYMAYDKTAVEADRKAAAEDVPEEED